MKFDEIKSLGRNTRFIFAAPRWYLTALLVLAASFLMGLTYQQTIDSGIYGIFIAGLPAFISVILTQGIARAEKETYWVKTELFLSLFYIVLASCLMLAALLISLVFPVDMQKAFLMSLTVPLWLRHVYLSSVITTERKGFPLSFAYPFSILMLMPFSIAGLGGFGLYQISVFIIFSSVSLFFASLFLKAMDRPLMAVLGVGGLEFTRWTIEHYKERSERGKRMLESIFDRFGEEADISVRTLSFKGKDISWVFSAHTAHPGPFGEVGGANLPKKLSEMSGIKNLITPHGASLHDMNPTSEKEVLRLAGAIKSSIGGRAVKASAPVRTRHGEVGVLAQRFGEYLLVVETSSPKGTEDIDPSVAELLEEKVRAMGYEALVFIDGHNCSSDKADETFVYSRKYADIEGAVLEAAQILKDADMFEANAGLGHSYLAGESSIGPMGIFSTVIEAGGRRTAYIVIDGNNMKKGLRESIISEAGKMVEHAEVMTTDNHYVNRVDGGKNPVGSSGNEKGIISACMRAVKESLRNLGPVRISAGSSSVILKVFGHGRSAALIAVPKSVTAMGKYLAALSMFSMLALDAILAILI